MSDDYELGQRIQHMQKAVGHLNDTLLFGMVIAAFGFSGNVEPDISPEHLKKIDNRDENSVPTQEGHLEYLRDRFGLKDMVQAQNFANSVESKLQEMYRKMARTELSTGIKIPDNQIFITLQNTIFSEAEKQSNSKSKRM